LGDVVALNSRSTAGGDRQYRVRPCQAAVFGRLFYRFSEALGRWLRVSCGASNRHWRASESCSVKRCLRCSNQRVEKSLVTPVRALSEGVVQDGASTTFLILKVYNQSFRYSGGFWRRFATFSRPWSA
jgi:hypothetical protein